jgi:hypothetical protein
MADWAWSHWQTFSLAEKIFSFLLSYACFVLLPAIGFGSAAKLK